MKKTRRSFLMCIVLLVLSLCMAIAACAGGSTVKFSFETNGGAPIESVEVEKGTEYELPTPVWEGHGFAGWYTDKALTEGPVTKVTAEKNTTFYAKWADLAVITLDLGGGTLEGVTDGKLYLKAGENIAGFMSEYVPVKNGYEFGEWLDGGEALSRSKTMPEGGITLTAHYKVGYTVETYLQTLDGSGYERGDDIIGYEYAGTNYTPRASVHGFSAVSNANAVTTKVLADTPSENIFTFYFDREEYTVNFRSNYPAAAGMQERTEIRSYLYGTEVVLPDDMFAVDSYVLMGWATSESGAAVYASGYIESRLFNADSDFEPETFKVDGDTMLYAVWSKGYTDLFGGYDTIFLLGEDARVIYLYRAGFFFQGNYYPQQKEFIFYDENDRVLLTGVLNDDGLTYSYSSDTRAGYSATLYTMGRGLDDSVVIYFDEYNGIRYAETIDSVQYISRGTYTIDENLFYITTFTEGEKAGETWTISLGRVTVQDSAGTTTTRAAFRIRNEEEYGWGEIMRGVVYKGALTYYTNAYMMSLDGFGTAAYYTGSSVTGYYYVCEGDTLTLLNSSYEVAGTFRFLEIGGRMAYMPYTAALDVEFTSNGASLKLDGVGSATYTTAGGSYTGYYTYETSALGGYIIHFTASNGTAYTFLAQATTNTVTDENGTETSVTVYTLEQRLNDYAEYYYSPDASSVYYSPLVVFHETKEGQATIYGRTSAGTYVKIAYGSYTYNEAAGTYHFTVDQRFDEEVATEPIDFSTVNSFVFAVGLRTITSLYGTSYYYVNYWYSMTTDEGTTSYEVVYTAADGATLTFVADFAVYRSGDTVLSGTCSTSSGITVFTSGNTTMYFELNESEDGEEKTFVVLSLPIGTMYAALANGMGSEDITLTFDGKGKVVYTDGENTYEGTFRSTGRSTEFNSAIYEFTSDELTFEYIIFSTTYYTYFARYNGDGTDRYSETDGAARLQLDGFSYIASYTDQSGTITGYYYWVEEDVVCLTVSGYYFYFDIDGHNFTMRGLEYGTYLLIDNNYTNGIYVTLDGYGRLTAFTYEEDENGDVVSKVLDADGSYRFIDNGIEINFVNGAESFTLVGSIGTYTVSNSYIGVFVVAHSEIVRRYVNERDWSVIELDSYGNVTKYDHEGVIEYGSYVLITTDLLYYVNSDGTDACIYKYDVVKGTATPIKYSPRGYYTSDLESLIFSEYGFMIFNGETRYYYYVEDDGNVTIYHLGEAGDTVNEYGFIVENFGEFSNVKDWDSKRYYANDGYSLGFNRVDAEKFPLISRSTDANGDTVETKWLLERLTFTPSGSAEFTVSGVVQLGGENRTCYVTRRVLEDGSVEMYVTVGYYRYDITVTYTGERSDGTNGNSYEVTSFALMVDLLPEQYLYFYYVYYMFFGVSVGNSFGQISIVTQYDENGEVIEDYITGEFGVSSGMLDADGNLITLGKETYSRENGLYVVEFDGADGYKYRIRFSMMASNYANTYSYLLYAFSRVQEFETDDGFKVIAERIIASDQYSAGSFWTLTLYDADGEEISPSISYLLDGKIYFIVRETDDEGKITATKYYVITLTEKADEGVDTPEGVLVPYESATVEVQEITTVYNAEGDQYVDIDADGNVRLFYLSRSAYLITESSYDEESGVITFQLGNRTYTVKFADDGTVDIEQVVEE